MDLIQATAKVKEKEKAYQQLQGRKAALMDTLKKLGFDTVKKAKAREASLEKEISKMEAHLKKGEEQFKENFAHLLT